MVSFIRSLFESALKTNPSLEFAVVTDCLRISRESNVPAKAGTSEKRLQRFLEPSPLGDGLFTGLNNLDVISILDENYAEYFGFVQEEINQMFEYYSMSQKLGEAKEWYNGYLFGNTEVYNPWSIINYVKDIIYKNMDYPKPYWSNTSSNSIVKELIEMADNNTKCEIEGLVAGGTLEKPVHEDITYGDIYKSQDNLWNFLFFTGYLKVTGRKFKNDTIYLSLKIPNREIRYIYSNTITEWFNARIKASDFSGLYNTVVNGNTSAFEDFLKKHR